MVTKLYRVGIEHNPKAAEKYWEGEFNEVIVDDSDEIALLLPRKC
jgi:hypothetical protein